MQFPFFRSKPYKITISLTLGIFLFLFLIMFLPFGVSNYNPDHKYTIEFLGYMASFMLLTVSMSLLNEFLLKPLLIKNPGSINVIVWSLWLILVLGLSIFILYNYYGNWHDFSVSSAVSTIFNCAAVFVFPLVGVFFYFRFKNLKVEFDSILTNRSELQKSDLIGIRGQGVNDRLSVSLEDLLMARAQDNYVEVSYINNGAVKKELLRLSMYELTEQLTSPYLVRCHRSYIVNLYNVRAVKGGSKLELFVNHLPEPIKVSTTYREEVGDKLSALKLKQV